MLFRVEFESDLDSIRDSCDVLQINITSSPHCDYQKTLPCKIAVHNLTATTTTPTTTSPALSVTTTTTASLDFFGDDFLSALSTTPGSRLAEVGSLSMNAKSGRILLIARQMRHFSA